MSNNYKKEPYLVPGLSQDSYKILSFLLEGNGECYFPYKTIERVTGLERDTIKRVIDIFKQENLGIIEYQRGLMTEEGEVAGSGFGIPWGNPYNRAELAIYRYKYGFLDRQPVDTLPNEININGTRYVVAKEESNG